MSSGKLAKRPVNNKIVSSHKERSSVASMLRARDNNNTNVRGDVYNVILNVSMRGK